ncbi:MAG: alpha/beta hydrolase-fold protein [Acinetobacter sp.]
MKKINVFFASLCLGSMVVTGHVTAKPVLQPLGPNIAETGSPSYTFKVFNLDSQDGQRHYRVWLGLPRHATPATGYPVLYLLDGNKVMDSLNEKLLYALNQRRDAPVLVSIGYQTNLPFDVDARTRDYTLTTSDGKLYPDPRNPARLAGGSTEFREVLLQKIIPWVNQNTKVDPQRKAIFGHSYGGLFVLDTYLNSHYFTDYFAASPSVTWADGKIQQPLQQASAQQLQAKRLWILEGDMLDDTHPANIERGIPQILDTDRKITRDLQRKGADVKLVAYPNVSHGEMFQKALFDVLSKQWY